MADLHDLSTVALVNVGPHTPASAADRAPRWRREYLLERLRSHAARAGVVAGGVLVVLAAVSTGLSWFGWRSCTMEGTQSVCRETSWYPLSVQRRTEWTSVDGVASGRRRDWYPNGQLWIEGEYRRGQREGVWREYWMHGTLRFEGAYRRDVLEGTETWYWPNGRPEWQVSRHDGARNGDERWWHENGHVRRLGAYVGNQRHGTFTVFGIDGTEAFSGEYASGILVRGSHAD